MLASNYGRAARCSTGAALPAAAGRDGHNSFWFWAPATLVAVVLVGWSEENVRESFAEVERAGTLEHPWALENGLPIWVARRPAAPLVRDSRPNPRLHLTRGPATEPRSRPPGEEPARPSALPRPSWAWRCWSWRSGPASPGRRRGHAAGRAAAPGRAWRVPFRRRASAGRRSRDPGPAPATRASA